MGYAHSKPDALKKAQGTLQKHRVVKNNMGKELQVVVSEPPDTLSAEGVQEWNRVTGQLEKLGILHTVSLRLLENYCMCYDVVLVATRDILENGITIVATEKVTKKENGDIVTVYTKPFKNPAINTRKDHMVEMRMIAGQFGFTPSSASRIQIPEKPKQNAFEKLKKRK